MHIKSNNISVFISFCILIICFLLIVDYTQGHFVYTLDDPYIHLKLAQNIASGHYGINSAEFSAPSSSIIWPFLLVPFSLFASFFEYVPLVINITCALLSALILEKFFYFLPIIKRTILVVMIMFGVNIYGLVFTGLEHNLQVLLVIFITYYLCYQEKYHNNQQIRLLLFVSIFLLPLVRYEGLALSLPILFFLFKQGYKKEVSICFVLLMGVVIAFSLFLYTHNLGYLPSSVIAKTLYVVEKRNIFTYFEQYLYNIFNNLIHAPYIYIISIALFFIMKKHDKNFAYVILVSSILHLIFGKIGWFGRYEVYQCIFVIMISFSSLLKYNINQYKNYYIFLFVLLMISSKLFLYIILTPRASLNIYNQQFQIAKIAKMLDAKVAVNDLGLISLKNNHDVLDLYGLGSKEALDMRLSHLDQSLWLANIVKKHDVHYIMIYDEWFPNTPKEWIKIARLETKNNGVNNLGCYNVAFYTTDIISANKLFLTLKEFSRLNQSRYYSIHYNKI